LHNAIIFGFFCKLWEKKDTSAGAAIYGSPAGIGVQSWEKQAANAVKTTSPDAPTLWTY